MAQVRLYVVGAARGPAGGFARIVSLDDVPISGETMVDPNREPLEGVVEVDQAEIPFREGDAFFEPGNAGKIRVIGAVRANPIAQHTTSRQT